MTEGSFRPAEMGRLGQLRSESPENELQCTTAVVSSLLAALSAAGLLTSSAIGIFVDQLLPQHRDFLGRLDADADLVALDAQHRDLDVLSDDQALARPPG